MSAVALAIDAPTRPNPNHKRPEETNVEAAEQVPELAGRVAMQAPSVAVTNEDDDEEEGDENSVDIEEMYRQQLEDADSGAEEGSSSGDGSDDGSVQKEPVTQPKVVVQSAAEKARATKLLLAAHAQSAAHRRAMVENKNIQQWIGITESHMPRVLSICVRTSIITVNLLEAAVLRDLVFSKIHNVIDL
jgi:hypothetical protein